MFSSRRPRPPQHDLSSGDRARPTRSLLTVSLALLLVGGLAVSGCGSESSGRVLVLGLDGLDPEAVDLLLSEGKMPNLAKIRQHGAYGRLRSQKPLLSPIVWTTIATGRNPTDHGIGHFVALSESGEELPATSDLRRVEALWTIASRAERRVVTVGWWATWPPEPVNGVVVSDHTAYHFLFEGGMADDPGASPEVENRTYPAEAFARIAPHLVRPGDLALEDLAPFVDVEASDLERPFSFDDDLAHFRWALATAKSYRDIALDLWRSDEPDLELAYIEATDSTAHLFGHLFRTEDLGGELAEQQRRYGRAVEAIYLLADEIIGNFVAALDDETTLVILSDHGFQLGQLHDDPSKTRDLRRVSEKFHREEGVLYLYGNRVRRGARIDQATILDITPTVLSLLGIPAAVDMPGRILTEALDLEPLPRIPTWESGDPQTGTSTQSSSGRPTSTADGAVLEHLQSLGYLGGSGSGQEAGAGALHDTSSPQGERNLAAMLFEEGRYREAAEIYSRLVAAKPDDASLHTSLAGCLGALGRLEQALAELEKAIAIEPLNVEAYHNRAVLEERAGDRQSAIADYRRALRYSPQYEPSQRALLRLTGSAEPRELSSADRQAMTLLDRAADAARKTDFGAAERLLAEAEAIAPELVLVHQYRSNVAYLQGDRHGAVAALRHALELEPDNALFRRNLEQLEREIRESRPD